MSEDRARILNMLSAGKISAEEAEALLDALDSRTPEKELPGSAIKGDPTPLLNALPKYLYVKVESANRDNVDVKVPLALVRSGLKLTSLIPPQAMDQVNKQLSDSGISIDFSNMKAEDIDDLIGSLREMEVNVNSADGDKVRVYCE